MSEAGARAASSTVPISRADAHRSRRGATLRMPGIGGTGVVTVSQMLAAAAKMDGLDTHSVDQTGLSQKAGPVVSTVSIGEYEPGRIDVLIGFDLLASVTPANLAGLEAATSVVVASTTITPTGRMVGKVATAELDPTPLVTELDARTRSEPTPTSMRRA